jgi:hypothetical protein
MRHKARMWTALGAVIPLLAMGGCTGSSTAKVATAGGTTPPASPTGSDTANEQAELKFVACMRGEGIDMVDPTPGDTSGRSAVRYMIDVKGMGSDPAFQAALDTCQNLLPAVPDPPAPAAADLATMRAFAACMRSNGMSDFPDPDPSGKTVFVPMPTSAGKPLSVVGVGKAGAFAVVLNDPRLKPALEQCRTVLPEAGDLAASIP